MSYGLPGGMCFPFSPPLFHASPRASLGEAGEMLAGTCLGRAGEGFSLDWEELGIQGREKRCGFVQRCKRAQRAVS